MSRKMKSDIDLDKIYRDRPLSEIPWNNESPPEVLVELVERGRIKPCKALDLGCGAGNYAIYLAEQGFEVTGIDISPTAIKLSEDKAEEMGVKCTFLAADVLGDLREIKEDFDFIYDWLLLHHLFPEDRHKYIGNVQRLLRSGGRYMSTCFSEEDPQFGGKGKFRQTTLGTVLYFSSEEELKELYSLYFNIDELKTIELLGKFAPHRAVYAFMQKK
jgi:2-polyprenyl-3-methyl-5-hydroxy-6-metoxy-1,4-benzoquinol methylase